MDRRDFIAAAGMTALAAAPGVAAAADAGTGRQILEWREYRLLPGDKKKLMNDFVKDVEIPALNRLGAQPVGVFNARFGGNNGTLSMLIPYASADAFVQAEAGLAADTEYQKAGADVLNCDASDPAYERIERKLMIAFEGMPKVAVPTKSGDRVFELRVYESHNRERARKKIEMFNKGEIDIFKSVGMKPVFYGESLTGDNLPNLTYMLAFDSMDIHDSDWAKFSSSPDWKRMSGMEEYKGTVSCISASILRPAGFSQI